MLAAATTSASAFRYAERVESQQEFSIPILIIVAEGTTPIRSKAGAWTITARPNRSCRSAITGNLGPTPDRRNWPQKIKRDRFRIRVRRERGSESPSLLPDRSCAVSQRGCLPRPDQVSAGFFGFRYLGRTFGYGRRWRSEVITLLADPSLCNRSSSLAFSIANSRVNFAVTCSWSSHRSSMAIDFKSLFSIGPTIREAVRHHRW